jgi:Fe-S-cluster containining protein
LHGFAHQRSKNARRADQFCDRFHILELRHPTVRCLSIHATYVCAHAGECCRAGWTIPVEEHLVRPLGLIGIDIGRSRVAPSRPSGECVFFEAETTGLCTIHRRGGPALLPSVCRHFPRVVVSDPRGMSVTLSHFCPTAANLLFTSVPIAIVEAPTSLSLGGALEGLDATSVLPPLLSKDVLMDWDGYTAWEEAAVTLFNAGDTGPEQTVDRLLTFTERVCTWKPGRESLSSRVRRELPAVMDQRGRADGKWGEYDRPIHAFLASHAFASWAAYEPDGLRSVAAAVHVAFRTLADKVQNRSPLTHVSLTEAIRATDLELRHRL